MDLHEPQAFPFDQGFGNLNGIEGGTLPKLIAHHPHRESVFEAVIDPHPADGAVFLLGVLNGHGVAVGIRQIEEFQALEFPQSGFGVRNIDRGFEFCVDADGMGPVDGDAYASAGNPELGEVKDFTGLVSHLHLFLGVSVFAEGVDMGNEVEGNGVNEGGLEGSLTFLPGGFFVDLMVEGNGAVGPGA